MKTKEKKIISEFRKIDNILTREWTLTIEDSILKKIFEPYDDDPDFIMVYDITLTIANKILEYQSIEFDLDNNLYELGTYR